VTFYGSDYGVPKEPVRIGPSDEARALLSEDGVNLGLMSATKRAIKPFKPKKIAQGAEQAFDSGAHPVHPNEGLHWATKAFPGASLHHRMEIAHTHYPEAYTHLPPHQRESVANVHVMASVDRARNAGLHPADAPEHVIAATHLHTQGNSVFHHGGTPAFMGRPRKRPFNPEHHVKPY